MRPEDKKIVNQLKNKRKNVKKAQNMEEDDFDKLLDTYKTKVLKKIKTDEGEKGVAFEEVQYSD